MKADLFYKLGVNFMENFDPKWYLDNYKDVALSGMDPYYHYQKIGKMIGRLPKAPNLTITSTNKVEVINSIAKTLKGDFNLKSGGTGEIFGWLALIGDNTPREIIVKIDALSFNTIANLKREDLIRNKINEGCHGFRLSIPAEFMDGRSHIVSLIDSKTNKIIRQVTTSWQHNRKYTCFDEYLAEGMLNPTVYAPFREEDKRCFAMMENVSRSLIEHVQNTGINTLISVIMPAYNRQDTIGAAIDSVLKQNYQNYELIIIDDGSIDDTVEVINSYKSSKIRLIKGKGRSGVSEARNLGLRESEGDVIAYLDSDNTWEPDYLGAMIGALDKSNDSKAAYCGQYLYRGVQTKPFAIRFASFNKSLMENRNYIDLNCFVHFRDILNVTGMFNTQLKRFVDWDLILKISSEFKIISVPVILSNYYYELAENAITNDHTLNDYIHVVREQHNTREFIKGRALLRYGQIEPIKNGFVKPKLDHNISVVIPNYESLDDIKECLSSIRKHYTKDTVEIIVVDNASSAEVRSYLKNIAVKEMGIVLIENDVNYGFTYAVNQGIQKAKSGNDIVLLNNDALITRMSLVEMQNAIYKDHAVGIIVPRQVLYADTKTIATHVPFANPKIDCDVNLSIHHKNIEKVNLLHDGEHVEINFAPFFCIYMRRELIDSIGGLDAEYGRHYRSDRIMCDYVRHYLNLKVIYVSNAVVYHKLQKATDGLRESKTSEFDLMFKKNQWDSQNLNKLGYKLARWDL